MSLKRERLVGFAFKACGFLLLTHLLGCGSSQSKPENEPPTQEMATKASGAVFDPNIVELELGIAYAPRRNEEMEVALVLDRGVQSCLRESLRGAPETFEVRLFGKLNFQGQAEKVKIKSEDPQLNSCLEARIASIQIGRGQSGPFQLRISRVPTETTGQTGPLSDPPRRRGKPFRISLTEVKKFQ